MSASLDKNDIQIKYAPAIKMINLLSIYELTYLTNMSHFHVKTQLKEFRSFYHVLQVKYPDNKRKDFGIYFLDHDPLMPEELNTSIFS